MAGDSVFKRVVAPVAALLAAGAVGGLAAVAAWEALDDDPAPAAARAAATAPAEPAADSGGSATGSSIPSIIAEAMPSVVQITASPPEDEPQLPRPERRQPPLIPPVPGIPGSTGSGWLLDAEGGGHVVTNQHVVSDASEVTVTFQDGTEVSAQVLGSDPSTDVAVLQLEEVPAGVRPLPFGDAGSLQIGEPVIAIGSPFGLQGTVTSGIVSALDRDIRAPDGFTIDGAIQTDAALNHGNSGGPLLDGSGRVVGMNAQIASESGGNDGVGYAIPIETVREIAAQLIEDGRVRHAYLGVQITDATDGGAEVVEVVEGGPADDAGLEVGDVVVRAGDDAVDSSDDLRDAVSSRSPGDELELDVRRGDDTETVTVELGARPTSSD